jgi:hypothetical protein
MQLDVQMMHGIPDAELEKTVSRLKADPNYVSHNVVPEGDGKNTIEVTVKVGE